MQPDMDERTRAQTRPGSKFDHTRRSLLRWVPLFVFGSIAASMATAALRFLRPGNVPGTEEKAADAWVEVAPLDELSGSGPLLHEIEVEQRAGWSVASNRRFVFVLPAPVLRVLSATCTHEACTVEWSAEAQRFLCPCHESSFGPGGERLDGPAPRDLVELPHRVEGGLLKVRVSGQPTGVETDNTARG